MEDKDIIKIILNNEINEIPRTASKWCLIKNSTDMTLFNFTNLEISIFSDLVMNWIQPPALFLNDPSINTENFFLNYNENLINYDNKLKELFIYLKAIIKHTHDEAMFYKQTDDIVTEKNKIESELSKWYDDLLSYLNYEHSQKVNRCIYIKRYSIFDEVDMEVYNKNDEIKLVIEIKDFKTSASLENILYQLRCHLLCAFQKEFLQKTFEKHTMYGAIFKGYKITFYKVELDRMYILSLSNGHKPTSEFKLIQISNEIDLTINDDRILFAKILHLIIN